MNLDGEKEKIEITDVISIDDEVEDSVIIEIQDSSNSEPVWNSSGHGLKLVANVHKKSSHGESDREAFGGYAMGGSGTVCHMALSMATATVKEFPLTQATNKSPDQGGGRPPPRTQNLVTGEAIGRRLADTSWGALGWSVTRRCQRQRLPQKNSLIQTTIESPDPGERRSLPPHTKSSCEGSGW